MVDNELSCFMNSLGPAQKGKKKNYIRLFIKQVSSIIGLGSITEQFKFKYNNVFMNKLVSRYLDLTIFNI